MKVRQLRAAKRIPTYVAALRGETRRERQARQMSDGLARHMSQRLEAAEAQLKRARLVLGQYSVVLDPQVVQVDDPLGPIFTPEHARPEITFIRATALEPVLVRTHLDHLSNRRHALVRVGKRQVGYALTENIVLDRRYEWPSVALHIAKAIAYQLGEQGMAR